MKTTRQLSVSEFKVHALRLFQEVFQKRRTLIVSKRGVPLAEVRPVDDTTKQSAGRLSGTIVENGDITEPLGAELWSAAK